MRILALIAAVAAVLAACAPEGPSAPTRVGRPAQPFGSAWRLVAMQNRPVSAGPDVTLLFGRREVSGNGSCNAFGGSLMYDPPSGSIRIGDLVSTKRACVESGQNELEAAYLASLRSATDASTDANGRLVLTGLGSPIILEVAGMPAGSVVSVATTLP